MFKKRNLQRSLLSRHSPWGGGAVVTMDTVTHISTSRVIQFMGIVAHDSEPYFNIISVIIKAITFIFIYLQHSLDWKLQSPFNSYVHQSQITRINLRENNKYFKVRRVTQGKVNREGQRSVVKECCNHVHFSFYCNKNSHL